MCLSMYILPNQNITHKSTVTGIGDMMLVTKYLSLIDEHERMIISN